ncbi:MAG: cytochrome c [Actinomycetota bacterium]
MSRRRKIVIFVIVVLAALLAAGGVSAYTFLTRNKPVNYASVTDEYKYGSLGTEEKQGIPYELWAVLPDVFSDLLPPGTGSGYKRFGFIYEPGHDLPIATTYRERPIGLVGLNCAACHTGTYRAAPNAPENIVLGMPSNRFRIEEYIDFLRRVGADKRFNADTLLEAIDDRFPGRLSWGERLFWRYGVIPKTKDGLQKLDKDFSWSDSRPPFGPGRVDTFNPLKVLAHFDMSKDQTVGTVDFPSIWNQGIKRGMQLHWDGNNTSLLERNISAARAVGATADSLDLHQMSRLVDWLLTLPAPKYPGQIDAALARRGETIYDQQCASCHSLGGSLVGKVTPIAQIGTDRHRLDSFTPQLAHQLDTEVGNGKPWKFRHFRKTHGYANLLLDGLWLRAPYLHNGSVPNLRDLLFPAERPTVFYTGYDVYDWKDVGFVTSGPAARREGFRYDTRLPGNGKQGHLYGTKLPAAGKLALIEYLKTR